jgi:predicted RNA binding protein YcfA (HicA-like mRNA interferase family)
MRAMKPVSWRDFDRVLKAAGCFYVRQVGSHRIYQRPGLERPVVVPQRKEMPHFIMKRNLETLQITQEQFYELLMRKRNINGL